MMREASPAKATYESPARVTSAEDRAERGERLIAGEVPGLFVDLRHLVDVDHQQASHRSRDA